MNNVMNFTLRRSDLAYMPTPPLHRHAGAFVATDFITFLKTNY